MEKCLNCEKELKKKRYKTKFCNSSCSATFNNKNRTMSNEHKERLKKIITESEIPWSKIVGISTKGKYKKNIKSILELSSKTVQKIIKRLNLGCSKCGWNEGTCDIHHINGRKIDNPDNHENLSLVCPNCHRLVHENKIKKESLITLKTFLPDNWKDCYYG